MQNQTSTAPASETVAGLRGGHVNNELLDLRGRQEYTLELIDRLKKQLTSVLNDNQVKAEGTQTESPRASLVPLAEEIRARRDVAEKMNEELSDILARMEI